MNPELILGDSYSVFFGFTIVCMAGCGVLAGIATAGDWQPARKLLRSGIALGLLDRFLVHALFGGKFLSAQGFLVDTWCILMASLLAWRFALAARLVRQYPWMYRRFLIFGWRRVRRARRTVIPAESTVR